MDDLICILAVREQIARENAAADADPSIFAPWGIIHYTADWKSGKCDRPN